MANAKDKAKGNVQKTGKTGYHSEHEGTVKQGKLKSIAESLAELRGRK